MIDEIKPTINTTIKYRRAEELRDLLSAEIDELTWLYDTVNKVIHSKQEVIQKKAKEEAFIRYCRTGRFD